MCSNVVVSEMKPFFCEGIDCIVWEVFAPLPCFCVVHVKILRAKTSLFFLCVPGCRHDVLARCDSDVFFGVDSIC